MRKLLLIPPIIFIIISIIDLVSGDRLGFFLWLMLSFLLMLSLYSVAFKMEEKNAPVLHIFGALVIFFAMFTGVSYLDLRNTGVDITSSIILAPIAGLFFVALIMFLKGAE